MAPVVVTVSTRTFGRSRSRRRAVGEAQQRHVRRADGRRLGGGEPAAEDAAEDDDRRAERSDHPRAGLPHPGAAELRPPDVGVASYPEEHDDGQAQGHQQGRHDGGGEERSGRDGRQAGVDDRRDAGRHHRRDQRGRSGHAEREPLGVAVAQHGRDLQLAEGGGIRDRGSAHPREADAAPDADVAEAAPHPGEQGEREVEEPVRDAGMVGEGAQQDEERDGEQREAGRRLRDHPQPQPERLVVGQHVGQRRPDEREGDRHAHDHQADDEEREDQQTHSATAGISSRSRSGTPSTA